MFLPLPDLHVLWHSSALPTQFDVKHSRLSSPTGLQPHIDPLLTGRTRTWGAKQEPQMRMELCQTPQLLPKGTYEALGTRGCGCSPWAAGFGRSAPGHRSPQSQPSPAGAQSSGRAPGSGPELRRDPWIPPPPDFAPFSPYRSCGAHTQVPALVPEAFAQVGRAALNAGGDLWGAHRVRAGPHRSFP